MSSIREVAREANVSLSTVSKVLNRRADAKFALETRERVEAAARRVGYHPSAVARGLAGKRMNAIGVIMAYHQSSVTSDPYLGACLDGILTINKERHQKTILFTEDSWPDTLTQLPSYLDGHCDGLLLIIPRTDAAIIEELRNRGTHFVLVGDSREDGGLITADVENQAASRRLVEYLIGLGHRRIAAFCGNADFLSNKQRLGGYREALVEAGLPWREELIYPGEYQPEFGARNAHLMLNQFANRPEDRPTAIFCLNDAVALGTVGALLEAGINIPQEISVVGFDDSTYARSMTPQLTTVRHDIRAVGERATEALLDCIEGRLAVGAHIAVPADLVIRATTAPPA
jgi:DNA-binding LacI/PurR family transcriptional regulator